jgi:hypothetical protein
MAGTSLFRDHSRPRKEADASYARSSLAEATFTPMPARTVSKSAMRRRL